MMKVICAWCEREGKEGVMGEKEGPDLTTHSVCDEHQKKLLADVMRLRELKRLANPRRKR